MKIIKSLFPTQSLILNKSYSSDYYDSFMTESSNNNLSPLEIYILMVNDIPNWINGLLTLRNKTVQLLGLKDVGRLGGMSLNDNFKNQKKVGDKLDIFHIELMTKNEMILSLNDKHLDIKLSILKAEDIGKVNIFVSTVVDYHNIFGHLYMFFIIISNGKTSNKIR